MKIKKSVLKRLANNRGYALIMLALNCSHSSARDYVKFNRDDLTKASALAAFRAEFGLSDDEILETEVKKETEVKA